MQRKPPDPALFHQKAKPQPMENGGGTRQTQARSQAAKKPPRRPKLKNEDIMACLLGLLAGYFVPFALLQGADTMEKWAVCILGSLFGGGVMYHAVLSNIRDAERWRRRRN